VKIDNLDPIAPGIEDGEELVHAEFEEGIAFSAIELFEIENVLIEGDRFLDVRRSFICGVRFRTGPSNLFLFYCWLDLHLFVRCRTGPITFEVDRAHL